MKIIGTSERGYLIAASEREIAQLFGAAPHSADWNAIKQRHLNPPYGPSNNSIVGMEINVEAAYQQLSWLRRRNTEFHELVHKLRTTAAAIDDSRPLFDAVTGDRKAP